EVGQTQVVFENLVPEQIRLPGHGGIEHVVEFGIENVAGLGGVQIAQAEPLANEVLREGRSLRMLEHALHLEAQSLRLTEFFLFGQAEHALVGRGAQKEIGKPTGQGEVVQLSGPLAEKQEVR